MMPRERMIRTFEYNNPDKIPVVYHPSPAGLYVHGKKLLDLFKQYPPDNPIEFTGIPKPDPSTVKNGAYKEFKRDEWGTLWKYAIFGIQGSVKEYPVNSPECFETYEFPKLPDIQSPDVQQEKENNIRKKEKYFIIDGWISIFEKMHAIMPIEDILVDIYLGDERFFRFLDRMAGYMKRVVERLIYLGVDVIQFGDDWGIQTGPIISPEMFREVYRPRYEKIFDVIKKAGLRILFHSCGALGPILDELLDMGIDGIWHQSNLYDEKEFAKKCCAKKVTSYLHPDRQKLIPFGSPKEIREQIKRYADIYHQMGGGGIFYIEIENDAPFENVKALIEAVHEFR
jgi:uroporphyrinogen decarboxylase